MIVSLCGFMGAGKSTIGKHLARITGYKFIDLDNYIEQKCRMSIPEIFKKNGEEAFRAEELASLQEILEQYPDSSSGNLILSLGGGTVMREACAKLIKENTCCIYLYCNKEELVRRLRHNSSNRPLLKEKSDTEMEEFIGNLMQQRESTYIRCARHIVNTGGKRLQDVIEETLCLV